MHKVLQFTLVSILSITFLGINGKCQQIDPSDKQVTEEDRFSHLSNYIDAQDKETGSRIRSLHISTKESLSLFGNSGVDQQVGQLVKGELDNIMAAIYQLPSSQDLGYELTYLEESLDLIETELSSDIGSIVPEETLDCQAIERDLLVAKVHTLFRNEVDTPESKATIEFEKKVGQLDMKVDIRIAAKNARDFFGGLVKHTQLKLITKSGEKVIFKNKMNAFGKWDDTTNDFSYITIFSLEEDCSFSGRLDKVEIYWSNGIETYGLRDKTTITQLMRCQCKSYN